MATIIWRNKLYTIFSLEMSIYWKLLGLYLSTKDINPVLYAFEYIKDKLMFPSTWISSYMQHGGSMDCQKQDNLQR
jgi:hypothetical protein